MARPGQAGVIQRHSVKGRPFPVRAGRGLVRCSAWQRSDGGVDLDPIRSRSLRSHLVVRCSAWLRSDGPVHPLSLRRSFLMPTRVLTSCRSTSRSSSVSLAPTKPLTSTLVHTLPSLMPAQVRQTRYNFDESTLKPYLSLDAVTAAVFDVAGRLFGLKCAPSFPHPPHPVWTQVRSFPVP